MKRTWRNLILENLSYKVVALFISLILWLTILGRRDFVVAKDFEVEVLAGPNLQVSTQVPDMVKVKVSGPRTALRKFVDGHGSQTVNLDLQDRGEGDFDVEIPWEKIEVPFGVKIVSVRPKIVHVEIIKSKSGK
jgi:YbbR domain-containing protein